MEGSVLYDGFHPRHSLASSMEGSVLFDGFHPRRSLASSMEGSVLFEGFHPSHSLAISMDLENPSITQMVANAFSITLNRFSRPYPVFTAIPCFHGHMVFHGLRRLIFTFFTAFRVLFTAFRTLFHGQILLSRPHQAFHGHTAFSRPYRVFTANGLNDHRSRFGRSMGSLGRGRLWLMGFIHPIR